jgi:hypothetical protein
LNRWLTPSAFIAGACVGFGVAAFLTLRHEPRGAEALPGYTHRSLSFRIDNIDKVSKGRGDRYRVFDCREVAR